ncbi:hypothetical protein BGW41_006256 [Actinomortierella wolfii]|nr:hypothetical protein BGW41_006256 [Actinomortierella wolfii]
MFSSFGNRPQPRRSSVASENRNSHTNFTPTRPQPIHTSSSTRSAHPHSRDRRYRDTRYVQEIYIDDDDSEGDEDGGIIIVMRRAEPEVPVYYYVWLPYLRGFILLLGCGLLAIDTYTVIAIRHQVDGTIRRAILDLTTILFALYTFFGTLPIHQLWRLLVVEMHGTYREYMLNKQIRKNALEGESSAGEGSGYELNQHRRERVSSAAGTADADMYVYDQRHRTMRSLSRTSSIATLPAYDSVPYNPSGPTYYHPPSILPTPSQPSTPPPPNFDEAIRSGSQPVSGQQDPARPQPAPPSPSPPAYPATNV